MRSLWHSFYEKDRGKLKALQHLRSQREIKTKTEGKGYE